MNIQAINIDVWVFDLDNTLYNPLRSDLMPQMHQRMQEFIMAEFSVDLAEADRRRQFYYEQYGTTLRGLMEHHGLDPEKFLPYCHKLDLSGIRLDKPLDNALSNLPGRKIIYTNATEAHAVAVMDRLGISSHFEAVFDIADANYLPKPYLPSYELFLKKHAVDPKRAVMFEDTAKNLKPAYELGMSTVWMKNSRPGAIPDEKGQSHIQHIAEELSDFLRDKLIF
jgi:putative hydrolase of the HAD superfamily